MSTKIKKLTEQEIIFPKNGKLKLGDKVITLRPCPMSKIPLVMDSLSRLFIAAAGGTTLMDLMKYCIRDIIDILPYCIVEQDITLDDIDGYYIMDVAELFLHQNMSEEKIDNFLHRSSSLRKTMEMLSSKVAAIASAEKTQEA